MRILNGFSRAIYTNEEETFFLLLLKLVCYMKGLECFSSKLLVTSSSEGSNEVLPKPLMYKHQEHYLCFDGDFDNDDDNGDDDGSDDDDDNGSIVDKHSKLLWPRLQHKSRLLEAPLHTQSSPFPSIIPNATPTTTTTTNLSFALINQLPATSTSSLLSPLNPFNFSYIDVTPPLTMTVSCAKLDTVTSSSCVYFEQADTDKYSLLSPVDIGLMLIMTVLILHLRL